MSKYLWQCRGARIHSDSWGTSTPEYDGLAFDVDYFAWVRDGMLIPRTRLPCSDEVGVVLCQCLQLI